MTGYATEGKHIGMKQLMATAKAKKEMFAVGIVYITSNGKGGIFTNE